MLAAGTELEIGFSVVEAVSVVMMDNKMRRATSNKTVKKHSNNAAAVVRPAGGVPGAFDFKRKPVVGFDMSLIFFVVEHEFAVCKFERSDVFN